MSILRLMVGMLVALCFVTANASAVNKHHRHKTGVSSSQHIVQAVDINSADAATLATLNGIGPKKAQAIVNYRSQHGSFKSLEDLTAVHGIGKKFLKHLEQRNPGGIVVK